MAAIFPVAKGRTLVVSECGKAAAIITDEQVETVDGKTTVVTAAGVETFSGDDAVSAQVKALRSHKEQTKAAEASEASKAPQAPQKRSAKR